MTVNVGGNMVKRSEQEVTEEKKEEVKINPADYWCDVILEKTTPEKAEDRGLPTDAFNVTYVVEGETRLDVTRSEKMANVFDLYYDKYGKGALQKIDYGCGTIRPNLWGVKATPPKKGKKRK
tara:strand:+ start:573 stop:938 length:366 start_codon:yes stop_codon:yes gene_type:complete